MPFTLLRISLALATFVWPAMASAMPGPISDLSAVVSDDGAGIYVSWNPPANQENIAYYNVYYSRTSILQNVGAFDDVAQTAGAATQITLRDLPSGSDIYIAVLPVNNQGVEADTFYAEVRVRFSAPAASSSSAAQAVSSSSAPGTSSVSSASASSTSSSIATSSSMRSSAQSSVQSSARSASSQSVEPVEPEPVFEPEPVDPFIPPQEEPLRPAAPEDMLELLSAQAISATGVLLSFSDFIEAPSIMDDPSMLFTIEDGSGNILPIVRMEIVGSTVTLITDAQTRHEVYRVQVSDALQGRSSLTGGTLQLNGQKSLLLFSGHSTGRELVQPVEPIAEVANLALRHERDGTTYVVTATWTPSASPGITLYRIFQSQDEGRMWSQAQDIPADTTSIRIARVTPGTFTLQVQAVAQDGRTSNGVASTVTLPSLTSAPAPDLSDTGAGIAIALAAAGGVLGWRKTRRVAR